MDDGFLSSYMAVLSNLLSSETIKESDDPYTISDSGSLVRMRIIIYSVFISKQYLMVRLLPQGETRTNHGNVGIVGLLLDCIFDLC